MATWHRNGVVSAAKMYAAIGCGSNASEENAIMANDAYEKRHQRKASAAVI